MLTAFVVVLGTFVLQGLTLKPLLRAVNLHDDNPVARELTVVRERAYQAAIASFADDHSPAAEVVRHALGARIQRNETAAAEGGAFGSTIGSTYRRAVPIARRAAVALRNSGEVGDDAFHQLEEELDQLEIAVGSSES